MIDRLELTVPPNAPPGEYQLAVGFYGVWTRERVPVTASSVPAAHNVVSLGEVQVVTAR